MVLTLILLYAYTVMLAVSVSHRTRGVEPVSRDVQLVDLWEKGWLYVVLIAQGVLVTTNRRL